MSRIHDALRKAEQEKANSPLPAGSTPADDGKDAASGPHDLHTPAETQSKLLPSRGPRPGKTTEVQTILLEGCAQHSWTPDRKMMLLFDRRNSVVGAEEFVTLRSHLDKVRQKMPLQTLLVTSPLPQEGKTMVAANLAQVIARHHERRVLLIDSDLRFSRLHLSLGALLEPGLSDYLRGNANEVAVLQRGQPHNLFFIPGGRPAPNPCELIGNGHLKVLVQRLAPLFDWIILDSPPVIPVSDAKLLADSSDGVLMVVQAGVTPFDLAQKACREFHDKKLLGVVLNGVVGGSAYGPAYYHKKLP